jgi:cytoskeletal protein CcmA (bactofilin family)
MALFNNAARPQLSTREQASPPLLTFPASSRMVEVIPLAMSQSTISSDSDLTYLDGGSTVQGKLELDGPVRIDGEVEGEIHSKDTVAIGEGAIVSADIKAAAIIVAGVISGELSESRRIEVYSTAQVLQGSLTAPEMFIDQGAKIEGTRITRITAAREDRKVGTYRKEKSPVAEPKGKEHRNHL